MNGYEYDQHTLHEILKEVINIQITFYIKIKIFQTYFPKIYPQYDLKIIKFIISINNHSIIESTDFRSLSHCPCMNLSNKFM